MKYICIFLYILPYLVSAQTDTKTRIGEIITPSFVSGNVEFLAADEMKGRDTGSPELEIVASFLASEFSASGLAFAPGLRSYYQPVPLIKTAPPTNIELSIDQEKFTLKKDLLLFSGTDTNLKGNIIFAGYGTPQDLDKSNVNGKIVLCLIGNPADTILTRAFQETAFNKNAEAKRRGAVALIEIVALPGITFEALGNYFLQQRITLQEKGEPIPHVLLRNIVDSQLLKKIKTGDETPSSLIIKGANPERLNTRNVIAFLEGSDANLREEFVILTAHYDHIGIGKKKNEGDSIFNGARDNALGTTALLAAARYLGQNRPARSVLLIGFTAEEKGLLGSKWYTEHPAVPLQRTVFNLNADGGGYNDKSIVTINGLEYTNTEEVLSRACAAFGLKAAADPVPQYNLYAGSDNYRFAMAGIPAINFAPGIKAFDGEIMKYYHQLPDHASSLDFEYVTKYVRSFVYAADLFSSAKEAPKWKSSAPFRRGD